MAFNNSGTINGSGTISVDLNNNGVVNVQNGLYDIAANLLSTTGKGQINIGTNGILELDKSASSNTIAFSDNTGQLLIEQLGSIANTITITGLQAGDSIQIPALPTGFKESFSGGRLTISNPGSAGAVIGTLVFAGSPSSALVQNAVVTCFAAGGRIATPDGPTLVERLKIGDKVRLQDGCIGEIQWTGRRHVDCHNHPAPEKVRPIRIAAHAFGRGIPGRDLLLSPDHAVFVDGVLIPVKYLENSTTIRQLKVRAVTYHHIELHDHAIVQAEGLTVESLLPGSDKTALATDGKVVQLHPDFTLRRWEAMGCAPLVVFGAKLEAVRRRLNRRAAAIGPWRLRRTG